jgi:3-methyladenine DNA glycosylase/8-oxoguanine DNA glycosylase
MRLEENMRCFIYGEKEIEYLKKKDKKLAAAIDRIGMLEHEVIPNLPDEEIIEQLSSLNGIGVWTAEMLLIFSMERPNIVSWGDLAIRRGIMYLWQLSHDVNK